MWWGGWDRLSACWSCDKGAGKCRLKSPHFHVICQMKSLIFHRKSRRRRRRAMRRNWKSSYDQHMMTFLWLLEKQPTSRSRRTVLNFYYTFRVTLLITIRRVTSHKAHSIKKRKTPSKWFFSFFFLVLPTRPKDVWSHHQWEESLLLCLSKLAVHP